MLLQYLALAALSCHRASLLRHDSLVERDFNRVVVYRCSLHTCDERIADFLVYSYDLSKYLYIQLFPSDH